jgi:alanine-glyoxylate transaminase/serine-glyoxylate transaminase/serine-pyruvate transaminase
MGYSSRMENVMLCLGALETVFSDMGMKVEHGAAESAAHYAYAANPLPVESKASAKAA